MTGKGGKGDEKTYLCAYNAGETNVVKWLNDKNLSDNGKSIDITVITFRDVRSQLNDAVKIVTIFCDLFLIIHNNIISILK